MRRRNKVIGVTFAALTSAAMIVGDVPSTVLLDGPSLAAESESITNSGVAVDGNVPPGFADSLSVPSADGVRAGLGSTPTDGGTTAERRANSNAGAGADDAAGDAAEAARRAAAARRDAAKREADARAEAEDEEADAREDAADREADARDDADDAEDDARDDADDARDFDRDDFEPNRP